MDYEPGNTSTRVILSIEHFADRYARFVVAERSWLILTSFVLTALLGLSLFYAKPSANARVFFSEDNPELVLLEELDDTYGESMSVVFTISARSGSILTLEGLKALAKMTEKAWQAPYVRRVESIANFQQVYGKADEIEVVPLYTAHESLTPTRLAEIEREVLSNEELVNTLVSPNGHVASIALSVVPPEEDPSAIAKITEFSRTLAAQWKTSRPFIDVRLTGGVIGDAALAEASNDDMRTLVPVMILLILAALAFGLRSIAAALVVMSVVACAAISGFGAAMWIGGEINPATATSPITIMVLTLASAVHLLISWIKAGAKGLGSKEAICASVRVNFAPIALTSLTTMLGFLSLNFADTPPLKELGNIVAIGTVFAWLFCLTLLPALISFVRPPSAVALVSVGRMIERIGSFGIDHPKKVIAGFLFVSVVMAYGASRIVLDDNYIRYFRPSFEFRQDADYTEKHLHGLNAIEYSLDSGSTGGVFNPDFLRKVDKFSDWYEQQPNVVSVKALPPMIKRLNQALRGGEVGAFRIADTRDGNAQSFLLYELSLPVGQDPTGFVDIDRAKTSMVVFINGGSSQAIKRLALEGDAWLRNNTPEIAGKASGLSVAFAYVSERNLRSMITGTAVALTLVSLILIVAFQSIRIGLLTLIPNLLPGLLAFGVWGFWVGDVNLAGTGVTSMTFGIIVDDTIHFTMKFLRRRRILGEPPDVAARSALATVGFPLFLTTVAIASGFAVVATSSFQLSHYLGTA